jgi:hypothetical protein
LGDGHSGYSSELLDHDAAAQGRADAAAVNAVADKRFDATELRMVERIGKVCLLCCVLCVVMWFDLRFLFV